MTEFTILGRLDGLNEYTVANRSNRYQGAAVKKRNQQQVLASLIKCRDTYDEPVYIKIVWYEANRKRDKDNIAFGKKYILDALVQKGILRNDTWECVAGFEDRFEVDKAHPRIEVKIFTKEEMRDDR